MFKPANFDENGLSDKSKSNSLSFDGCEAGLILDVKINGIWLIFDIRNKGAGFIHGILFGYQPGHFASHKNLVGTGLLVFFLNGLWGFKGSAADLCGLNGDFVF